MAERGGRPSGRAPKQPWPRQAYRGSWWREHYRVAGDSLGQVSRRAGSTLLAWLLVGIALALPAALYLVQSGLNELTGRWDHRPGLSVYFEPGSSPQALAALMRGQPGVQRVEVVTQAQALAEFRARAKLGDALEALESNPLPASLRIVPVAGTSAAGLGRLAGLVRQNAEAVEIVMEETWLERVSDASRVAWRLGVLLAVLFGVGAVLVTATSVRLAIEGRLAELQVMKLVGATDGQVRRPFLYLGLAYGLGGGMVAAMLLSLGISVLEPPLESLLGSYAMDFEAAAFSARFLGVLLGTGAILGVLGATMAVRQRRAGLEIL